MIRSFTIPGEPKGKQRPKFSTFAGRVKAITPQQTVNYETLVKTEYQWQVKDFLFEKGMQVYVLIDCFMAAPKSASKKKLLDMLKGFVRPTKKPDWDNMGKIICDSLNGIAYHDDSQVIDGRVRKFFSERPRVVVYLSDQEIKTNISYKEETTT